MTKIKNFRITIRSREIARTLKNLNQIPSTPELDLEIEQLIKTSKTYLKPAALYTTLTRATAEKATSLALPKQSIAVSVIAVNIGPDLEIELQAAIDRQDDFHSALLSALRQEALSQSIQFAMRLIGQQAKDEECEMSDPWPVNGPPLLSSLEALLGVQRIGISVDEKAPSLPTSARLVWTSWSPISKRSSKRQETSSKNEKVAA